MHPKFIFININIFINNIMNRDFLTATDELKEQNNLSFSLNFNIKIQLKWFLSVWGALTFLSLCLRNGNLPIVFEKLKKFYILYNV